MDRLSMPGCTDTVTVVCVVSQPSSLELIGVCQLWVRVSIPSSIARTNWRAESAEKKGRTAATQAANKDSMEAAWPGREDAQETGRAPCSATPAVASKATAGTEHASASTRTRRPSDAGTTPSSATSATRRGTFARTTARLPQDAVCAFSFTLQRRDEAAAGVVQP